MAGHQRDTRVIGVFHFQIKFSGGDGAGTLTIVPGLGTTCNVPEFTAGDDAGSNVKTKSTLNFGADVSGLSAAVGWSVDQNVAGATDALDVHDAVADVTFAFASGKVVITHGIATDTASGDLIFGTIAVY